MQRWLFLVLVISVLAGCGGGSDGGGGGKTPAEKAKTPEEALSWLNTEQRGRLDGWRESLVKTCDAKAIFSGSASSERALDLGLLVKKLGGRMLVRSDSGEFAFLGLPEGISGVQHVGHEETKTVNGEKVSVLSAQSDLTGTHCTVTLFGQKVYDGQIAQRVTVLGHYNPRKRRPKIKIKEGIEVSREGKALVSTDAFVLPVTQDLMGNDATYPFLETALGLKSGEGKTLFKLGAPYTDATIFARGLTKSAFSPRLPEIMADEAQLASLRQPGHHEEEFVWLLRPIPSPEGETRREAWAFTTRIAFDGSPAKGGTASLVSLSLDPAWADDDSVAGQCFVDRFPLAKLFFTTSSPIWVSPSFDHVAGPCHALASDLMPAILHANEARRLFVTFFNAITPSDMVKYGDWKDALIALAVAAADEKRDLAGALDADGGAPLVRQGALEAQSLIDGARELPELRNELIAMGFEWALRAARVDDRAGILEAIKRAAPSFLDSTRQLIAALASDPNGHADEIRFARALTAAYAASWSETQGLATAPGAGQWVGWRRAEALQKRWTPEQLKSWNATLGAAKLFADQDLARVKGSFHSTHDQATVRIVQRALDEGWTTEDFADLSAIAASAKIKMGCGFADSYAELANCVGLDKLSRKAGMLDPAFARRYGRFAPSAADLHGKLAAAESSVRWELENRLFDPIWKRCDNTEFSSRAEQLKSKVAQVMGLQDDFAAKVRVESEIRTLLQDCP